VGQRRIRHPSLRAMAAALPPGTRVEGYHPRGYGGGAPTTSFGRGERPAGPLRAELRTNYHGRGAAAGRVRAAARMRAARA
jgi:hypothetical protein